MEENFTFNEIWYFLENIFDLEKGSLKKDYMKNFEKFLDLFSINLSDEKKKRNISMFISDLGNSYKEKVLRKLQSFYNESGNLKEDLKEKLSKIEEQISEEVENLFLEDIYHKIGKNTEKELKSYKFSYKIELPIDILGELSEKKIVPSTSLYNYYLQNLKKIFIEKFYSYEFNPYKIDLVEIQKIKEKLEELKNRCNLNTAVVSNSIGHLLFAIQKDDMLFEIFEDLEIYHNSYYQDFTLFLNKDKFYLETEFGIKVQEPTEEDVRNCVESKESKIRIIRNFTTPEELSLYCKLSRIYILVDIALRVYIEENCGIILIEKP